MRKLSVLFTLTLAILFANPVFSCTNYLVTKSASTDGSTLVSYAADSHTLFGALYFWPAATYANGTLYNVYEWDTGKYLGKIKQAGQTYQVIGNMNEYAVTIGETTFGGREELGTQPGAVVDYGSLIYLALQRSKTAREAIKIMTDLVAEYGYASSGESFSVADPNEVWIMEMIGKGGEISLSANSLKNLEKAYLPKPLIDKLKALTGKKYTSDADFQKALNETIGKEEASHYWSVIIGAADKTQKGAVWVALLIPDGYVSGHANQARITTFKYQATNNFNDNNATVYNSADVITFAREKGWFKGKDEEFSFSDIYAPVEFGGARFCDMRVWAFFNGVSSEIKNNKAYEEYVMGNIKHDAKYLNGNDNPNGFPSNRMPLWVKADRKLSAQDIMFYMRNHLEGTSVDMTKDVGAGPFGVPYRWRPMTWKVDGQAYCFERATATQQTGFSFVAQMRSFVPYPFSGIYWFGVDDAASCVYTPIYSGSKAIPQTFAENNGSMLKWSENSAHWIFNQVTNLAYTRYNAIHPEIESLQKEIETKNAAYIPYIDNAAKALYEKDKNLGIQFVTDFSVNTANALVMQWKDFYQYLFMKYMDGNIKKTENYKLLDNGNGKDIPPSPNQPGYGEDWFRRVAKEHGDKIKVQGGGH